MTALLIVAVVILIVLCDVAYLLRQTLKRLDYQAVESLRQSLYLREIKTHALMTRRYAQHLSRRTRAPKGVTDVEGYEHAAVHAGTVASEAAAGRSLRD